MTERRHLVADLSKEVAVLRLLLQNHRTLLRVPGSLHVVLRRWLKMVRMLIAALLLLLLHLLLLVLLVKRKLRMVWADHL